MGGGGGKVGFWWDHKDLSSVEEEGLIVQYRKWYLCNLHAESTGQIKCE